MPKKFYRKSRVNPKKYAEVHGEKPLVKSARYKWPSGGGESGPPVIHNVMGQEDLYRQEGGVRADYGGRARIIVTTSNVSNVTVEYVANPSDEDNPVFDETTDVISENSIYHEAFFEGLQLNSLYAFKIIATNDSYRTESGVYYFSTGSELLEGSPIDMEYSATIEVVTYNVVSEGYDILVDTSFIITDDNSAEILKDLHTVSVAINPLSRSDSFAILDSSNQSKSLASS